VRGRVRGIDEASGYLFVCVSFAGFGYGLGVRAMSLYHYTCRDGFEQITKAGFIRPTMHPYLSRAVVWLTDLDTTDRRALGLTSYSLSCDRMEYRFEVDEELAVHWPKFFASLPKEVRASAVELCYADGVRPSHWFVSEKAIPVSVPGSQTTGVA
jgi:hypothetical protein